MPEKPRKRVWVQNVAVSVRVLETRLDVAAAQGLGPDQEAAAEGVREFLLKARNAAYRDDPIPNRLANWWHGTLVDAAYLNLHAARSQIIDVYDDAELAGEIPGALARAQVTLHRDDPRRIDADTLSKMSTAEQRALVRRSIEDSYDVSDRQHSRLRSFRNIILMSAVLITVLVGITIASVATNPTVMPLCFPSSGQPAGAEEVTLLNCPTGTAVRGPSSGDILVVALLGLLGGSLAAAVSIRNLQGTSTPYDVPVALAALKVPLGAFTAIIGLIAIRGDFVPGLSALDSQQQILAYALLFGFAQQAFTRLLDNRAQTLLEGIPGKGSAPSAATGAAPTGAVVPPPVTQPAEPGPVPPTPEAGPVPAVPETEPPAPKFRPNPEGDEDDQVQDDEAEVLPDVLAKDPR